MGRNIVIGVVTLLTVVVVGIGAFLYLDQAFPPLPAAQAPGEQPAPNEAPSAESSVEGASVEEPAKAKSPLVNGTPGNDVLTGTDGNDRIYAAEDSDPQGTDTIDAGPGDDRLYVDAGDSVQGGAGHDELIVRGSGGMTLALAGTGIEETWGGDGDDTFDGTGVSDPLTLRGGRGKDRLTGGEGDDLLYGGDGEDVLVGGPGQDTLKGEAGTDILTGGPGADVFSYTKFDGSTDIITDYNFAEGDTVTAASFTIHGSDTALLDEAGQTLFLLKDYDASVKGVGRRK